MPKDKHTSGRKRSSVTNYFHERPDRKNVCIFCAWTTAAGTTRLVDHILKCPKATPQAKTSLCSERRISSAATFRPVVLPSAPDLASSQKEQTTVNGGDDGEDMLSQPRGCFSKATVTSHSDALSSTSASSTSIGLDSFVCRMDRGKLQELQEQLCQAIYVTGAPFRMVDNPYWQRFFSNLNPSFKLPSSYSVANSFLDNERSKVECMIKARLEKVNSRTLTLITDGWTNIRRESVINYIICDPTPMFWASTTPTERHTSDFIANEIIDQMKVIGEQRISALVIDNAANMKGAWEKVQAVIPEVVTLGCASHGLNLLLEDFLELPSLRDFLFTCKSIVRKVNNTGCLRNAFAPNATQTLKLPVATRWLSWLQCLESIQGNRASLELLAVNRNVQNEMKGIKEEILSDNFWTRVATVGDVVRSITEWIKIMESDVPCTSLVPLMTLELEKTLIHEGAISHLLLSKKDEELFCKKFGMRCDFILGKSSVHFAANILDPHRCGRDLTPEQVVAGCEVLSTWSDGNFAAEMAQLRTRQGVFSANFLWIDVADAADTTASILAKRKKLAPLIWWSAFLQRTPLFPVAQRALSVVPSSASVERANSRQLFMHSKVRNRLLDHRVNSLMLISFNRRLESTAAAKAKEREAISKSFGIASTDNITIAVEEGKDEEEETADLDEDEVGSQ